MERLDNCKGNQTIPFPSHGHLISSFSFLIGMRDFLRKERTWEPMFGNKPIKGRKKKEQKKQSKMARRAERASTRQKRQGGSGPDHEAFDVYAMERKIREFVQDGTLHSITLRPMPPHHRAIVHQLARSFFIKSKSQGKDENRRTVLTMTPEARYRPSRVNSCVYRMARQNPKMNWGHERGKKGGKGGKGKGRGGGRQGGGRGGGREGGERSSGRFPSPFCAFHGGYIRPFSFAS